MIIQLNVRKEHAIDYSKKKFLKPNKKNKINFKKETVNLSRKT
jgi:hypothetical protein